MRPGLLLLVVIPAFAAAASAPVPHPRDPLMAQLDRARAEQAQAADAAAQLERAAQGARNAAARLRAEQAAAAQQIAVAEARMTVADAQLRLAAAQMQSRRARLQREQQPVAALLAGLATMGERPPLLAIADRGGIDELVEVRVLLDATLPVIRRRTAGLSAEIRRGIQLAETARIARAELAQSRKDLETRRQKFASLERQALERASATAGQAISAGDVALMAGENVDRSEVALSSGRSAAALASALVDERAAPARPARPDLPAPRTTFAYRLPASAAVTEGLGSINANGIRARGLTLATARGTEIVAPSDGVLRFSGPFRAYDGVIIIDHGGGWTSVLVNAASRFRAGHRVRGGEPLGRALGPLLVELLHNGTHRSPALIAGSSATLSKDGKGS